MDKNQNRRDDTVRAIFDKVRLKVQTDVERATRSADTDPQEAANVLEFVQRVHTETRATVAQIAEVWLGIVNRWISEFERRTGQRLDLPE